MEQFASPSSDNAGNRTSKKTYAYTTGTLGTVISTENYEYDGDRLTRVGSMQYTYDTIGNPTYYNGYTLEWEGRRLTRMSMNGGQFVYEFAYNADGIRTMKRSSGTPHVYALNGTQILTETIGNKLLVYLYDESGAPIGMQYRTTSYAAGQYDTYFFEKNLQGDIIAVYTENGTKIGSYIYDAWGNCTYVYTAGATSAQKQIISTLNPFRYRGYYYDTETGLYYLQTRYYSPQWGRFLNADGYVSTGTGLLGYNMFAYCNNNPVAYIDPTGNFPWLLAMLVVTVTLTLSSCKNSDQPEISHDVPVYKQKKNEKSCWAYAQLMMDAYDTKTIYSKSEAKRKANILNENNNANMPPLAQQQSIDNDLSILYNYFQKYGPLYGFYGAGVMPEHVVVITNVDISTQIISVNDPSLGQYDLIFADFIYGKQYGETMSFHSIGIVPGRGD